MNHRHAERRALVAETCGALALHVASDMRASLILSILQQMATDSDAIVRRATAQALAHLLPLLPDLHKFQAVSTAMASRLCFIITHQLHSTSITYFSWNATPLARDLLASMHKSSVRSKRNTTVNRRAQQRDGTQLYKQQQCPHHCVLCCFQSQCLVREP